MHVKVRIFNANAAEPQPREAQVPAQTWPRWLQATRFAGGESLDNKGQAGGVGRCKTLLGVRLGRANSWPWGRSQRLCCKEKATSAPKTSIQQQKWAKKSLFGSGAVQQDCAPGARAAPTGHILPLPGANGIPSGSDRHLHRACKVLWLHICLKSSAREMKVHRSLGTAPQEPRGSCREQEEQGCDLQGAGDSSEPVKFHPPRFGTGFVYGKKPARRRTAAPLRLDK